MNNQSLSYVRWKYQYHIVFIPKYRKNVRESIATLCKYKEVDITNGAVCSEHVHFSVAIPLQFSILKFIGCLRKKYA